MKFKRKNENGITLIALVITIIILLILSGLSLNLAIGQNGIITKTILAKEQYENATIEEQEKIKAYQDDLETNATHSIEQNQELPNLTADTDAGVQVKVPDDWTTEAGGYISTSTGKEVKELTKVATVYAVSIGNGECVPVPNGFYYVGGDFDNGVIISDNEADKYDGTTDKTTFEYTTSLRGNQFVWVPCSTSSYVKTSWGRQNAEWDTTIPKAEILQIEKYGGFYVGRYEAGLASSISEFTSNQTHSGSNQVYNQNEMPQSKAGLIPWIFIDWNHSKTNAENMYNTDYVSSGLITGTQWDVVLNTMKNEAGLSQNALQSNSNTWGNYMNTAIAYTGRKAKAYLSGSNWILEPFGTSGSGNTTSYSSDRGELLTTGASAVTEKYHIFDIAGNAWEWTEEDSHYANSGQYREERGGSAINSSSDCPACHRYGDNYINRTSPVVGFRIVLYIK